MAGQFLWKPISEGSLNRGALSVLLGGLYDGVRGVGIYDAEDNLLENLAQSPGREMGLKFYSRKPGGAYGQNLRVKVDYGDRQEMYNIPNGANRYEGDYGNENPVYSSKRPSSMPYLPPGAMGGGQVGMSQLPYYLGGQYPQFNPIEFTPITGADYEPLDLENAYNVLAQKNRLSLAQNSSIAQGLGLELLGTELAGLERFAPAAAALSRSQTAADNQVNQAMRTAQIDAALPALRRDLAAQGVRANEYAQGRLPGDMNSAFQLGVRSRAADAARVGGFGNNSSVAANISDLMSAEERFKVAQYGEGLLSDNATRRSTIELAPTEYSRTGSQIRVMPSVDAGTRAAQEQQRLDSRTIIDPSQLIQFEQQQRQFGANLQQQTQQFNATAGMQAQQFNASNQFAADLGLFNYNQGYLAEVQGAQQSDLNQQREDTLRAEANARYDAALQQAIDRQDYAAIAAITGQVLGLQTGQVGPNGQNTGQTVGGAIVSGIGSLLGIGGSSDSSSGQSGGSGGDVISSVLDLLGMGGDEPTGVASSIDGGTIMSDGSIDYSGAQSRMGGGSGSGSAGGGSFAGFSNMQTKNFVPVGFNRDAEPVYSSPSLATSSNIAAGANTVRGLANLFSSFGIGTPSDAERMNRVASASSNSSLLGALDSLSQKGDRLSFRDRILESIDPGGKARDVGGTALQVNNLYKNWDNLSPAQKAIGIAQVGLKANGYAGGNLSGKTIPNTNGQLTVGEGLGLAAQGYNTVQMVKNWNDMNLQQRIMGVTQTVAGVKDAAVALGYGPQAGSAFIGSGSVAPGTLSAVNAASGGGVSAPALLGAQRVGAQGATSGANAGAQGAASTAGQVLGAVGAAYGAYQIGENWGAGTDRAALGSAAASVGIGLGINALGFALGPIGWAALVAGSALTAKMKVGKHKEQVSRDYARDTVEKAGLVPGKNDWVVKNPDGTSADIGIDGNHQKFKVYDPSKLTENQRNLRELNAYETDYTNDMDFISGMGGIALSRLLNGNTELGTKQVGAQMGNAALGSVGHGKEMSQSNFSTVMQNLRAMYLKSGIKDKNTGYQMVSQLLNGGNITRADAVGIQQALNMVFDNDYKTATTLMTGRWNGVRAAEEINSGK